MHISLVAALLLLFIAASAAGKPIYQCNERVFTDGGCPANRAGKPVSSDTPISIYAAPKVRASGAPQPRPRRDRRIRQKARPDPCASIRLDLAQLKARRRRGYSSDTEERLDTREAELRQQLQTLCASPSVRHSRR